MDIKTLERGEQADEHCLAIITGGQTRESLTLAICQAFDNTRDQLDQLDRLLVRRKLNGFFDPV